MEERFFDRKVSRRRLIAGGAAVLGMAAFGIWEVGGSKQAEVPASRAQDNLAKTINWMKTSENSQIKQAAQSLQSLLSEVSFLDSGQFQKVPAGVSSVVGDKERKLQIVLSLKKFESHQFSESEAAFWLLQALYVYEKAIEDPRRYERDAQFQSRLQQEATRIIRQHFPQDRLK